jgi:hypothetical protein
MITLLKRRVARNIWVATLKVNLTTWPCSKIVSGPLLCYLKSDFKTISQKWSPYWVNISREQDLGRFHEVQGHSMTLQLNRVQSITILFEVGFLNYFTEMITILRWRVARNILVATLKANVTAWPCSKIVSSQ